MLVTINVVIALLLILSFYSGEGKTVPVCAMKVYGRVEVYFPPFLTLALDACSPCGQYHTSAALHWGMKLWYPLNRKLCGPQSWSGCFRKEQNFFPVLKIGGPGSVVGIVTGYGLDGLGLNPGGGEIFRTCPNRPWGPLSLLYNGYRVFSGGKEWPGHDADPSPPSSAMV
jgi:hypothetical protein